MRALTSSSPNLRELKLYGNNEVLAREGIDTRRRMLRTEIHGCCNNEVLAREGIDT